MSDRAGHTLLVGCYELGRQPLSLAWPAACLKAAGVQVRALDLAVEAFDAERVRKAALVAISVPMHTALSLGVRAARRVRAIRPEAHVCFYGLYAGLNADYLLDAGIADSVALGEPEPVVVALAQALAAGRKLDQFPGLQRRGFVPAAPPVRRVSLPVPDRAGLPPLSQYARYQDAAGGLALAGSAEATRGCLHTCRHCPIVPVYGGRFWAVPVETVLADIGQQVRAGARHIDFTDPDFLNGPAHARRLAQALHNAYLGVTFSYTAKVEHILQHAALVAELAALGNTFVTSAIESTSDRVLAALAKGHTAADLPAALSVLDRAGVALLPTLVAFTPWTTLSDYLDQLEFIRAHGLEWHIAPVQLSIRLLIPPRSAMLAAPGTGAWLGPLAVAAFTYTWQHPDPRVDALQAAVAERVAQADAQGEPAPETHAAIWALAARAAGTAARPGRPRPRPKPPRLTENWFC